MRCLGVGCWAQACLNAVGQPTFCPTQPMGVLRVAAPTCCPSHGPPFPCSLSSKLSTQYTGAALTISTCLPPAVSASPVQAARRHPYYRYGYAAAILVGLMGWGIATEEKKAHPEKFGHTPGKAPRATAEE